MSLVDIFHRCRRSRTSCRHESALRSLQRREQRNSRPDRLVSSRIAVVRRSYLSFVRSFRQFDLDEINNRWILFDSLHSTVKLWRNEKFPRKIFFCFRVFVFPFLIRGGKASSVLTTILAFIFCSLNSNMIAKETILYHDFDKNYLSSARFFLGSNRFSEKKQISFFRLFFSAERSRNFLLGFLSQPAIGFDSPKFKEK